MSEDCIFCKIIAGKIPSAKVYESEKILAFLDIGPVNKGHTLVVPKTHYETVMDTPDRELVELALAVKNISAALHTALKADGISVSQSNHRAAGQLVPHVHFHLIPRYKGDGFHHWPQGKYAEGEMERVRQDVAKFL